MTHPSHLTWPSRLVIVLLWSITATMPPCRFYISPTGCARGDTCRYQHIASSYSPEKRPRKLENSGLVPSLTDLLRQNNISNADTLHPNPQSAASITSQPRIQTPCRFFALGVCKNGDECRFLHPRVTEDGGNDRSRVKQVRQSSTLRTVLNQKGRWIRCSQAR